MIHRILALVFALTLVFGVAAFEPQSVGAAPQAPAVEQSASKSPECCWTYFQTWVCLGYSFNNIGGGITNAALYNAVRYDRPGVTRDYWHTTTFVRYGYIFGCPL